MAERSAPSFPVQQVLIFAVLFSAAGCALAGRQFPPSTADFENADKKQPEWFIEPDNTGIVLIPGIGRIMVPPQFRHHHHSAFPTYGSSRGSYGGNGGSSGGRSGRTGRNYIPGGDDTLIPNPGIEVPTP